MLEMNIQQYKSFSDEKGLPLRCRTIVFKIDGNEVDPYFIKFIMFKGAC